MAVGSEVDASMGHGGGARACDRVLLRVGGEREYDGLRPAGVIHRKHRENEPGTAL